MYAREPTRRRVTVRGGRRTRVTDIPVVQLEPSLPTVLLTKHYRPPAQRLSTQASASTSSLDMVATGRDNSRLTNGKSAHSEHDDRTTEMETTISRIEAVREVPLREISFRLPTNRQLSFTPRDVASRPVRQLPRDVASRQAPVREPQDRKGSGGGSARELNGQESRLGTASMYDWSPCITIQPCSFGQNSCNWKKNQGMQIG